MFSVLVYKSVLEIGTSEINENHEGNWVSQKRDVIVIDNLLGIYSSGYLI
jgi:hypothetical protein